MQVTKYDVWTNHCWRLQGMLGVRCWYRPEDNPSPVINWFWGDYFLVSLGSYPPHMSTSGWSRAELQSWLSCNRNSLAGHRTSPVLQVTLLFATGPFFSSFRMSTSSPTLAVAWYSPTPRTSPQATETRRTGGVFISLLPQQALLFY